MVEENAGRNELVIKNITQNETIHIPTGVLSSSLTHGCITEKNVNVCALCPHQVLASINQVEISQCGGSGGDGGFDHTDPECKKEW
jgi:hypothetical protein